MQLLVTTLILLDVFFVAYSLLHPAANLPSRKKAFRLSAIDDNKIIGTVPIVSQDPLLLRAARGEKVERVPVWMMRQAGRHMQGYRDLVKKFPTFRERSEIPEVAAEIR